MTEQSLPALQEEIKKCRFCQEAFGFVPRPVVWGDEKAPVVQISQAPGAKVHASGIPFSDASGKRLRQEWYQISDEAFYDPKNFYITVAGHCYPGKSKKGNYDAKPPACCWKMWTSQEIALKKGTRLYLLIGLEAASKFFPGRTLSDLVFEDLQIDGIPCYVLPHPSPLNRKWLQDHPDFEARRLPVIRKAIHDLLKTEE